MDNRYRSAQARLKQARAEYEVASKQVDYAVLEAPRDGVIVQRRLEVELWSQPGHIRELAPAADLASRTYSARVAFDDAEVPAELGQSALVRVRGQGPAPLSVPSSAVTAEDGEAHVWRLRADATLERVPVRIGAFGEERVPVLEGLDAGDWIVLAGVHLLHKGQAVRALDRDNRPVRPGE